jgi:hypothetical protein
VNLAPAAAETDAVLGVEVLAVAVFLIRTGAYSSTVFSEDLKDGPLKADAMLDFETLDLVIDALIPSNAV